MRNQTVPQDHWASPRKSLSIIPRIVDRLVFGMFGLGHCLYNLLLTWCVARLALAAGPSRAVTASILFWLRAFAAVAFAAVFAAVVAVVLAAAFAAVFAACLLADLPACLSRQAPLAALGV